jgi:Putative Actinobacterial Holin-X, holin superfamily III
MDDAERPPIKALLGQLVSDTSDFARAEIEFLRLQAGERANYAIPGLIMLGIAVALGFGSIIALLVGLILWLTPIIGAGWSTLLVILVALVITALLFKLGAARLRDATKAKEAR